MYAQESRALARTEVQLDGSYYKLPSQPEASSAAAASSAATAPDVEMATQDNACEYDGREHAKWNRTRIGQCWEWEGPRDDSHHTRKTRKTLPMVDGLRSHTLAMRARATVG